MTVAHVLLASPSFIDAVNILTGKQKVINGMPASSENI